MGIEDIKNSCVLWSIREVSSLPDARIIEVFLSRGWVPGQGTYPSVYLPAAAELGLEIRTISQVARTPDGEPLPELDPDFYYRPSRYTDTIGAFCRRNRSGTFLVRVNRHLLVAHNGKVYDQQKRRGALRRVINVYQVLNPRMRTRLPESTSGVTMDSPVVFATTPSCAKRLGTSAHARFRMAYQYWWHSSDKLPVTVRELVTQTPYTLRDAKWDATQGFIRVVED